MKVRREIVLGLVLFAVLAVATALVFPAVDDLFIENSRWNGLSEFYMDIEPIRVHSSDRIRVLESNSTLFILGPSRDFTLDEVDAVKGYLESGGRVVLADDFGTGNQLLSGLGVDSRFSGELLFDSVFYKVRPEFPRLLNFTTFDVKEVVLNYATVLSVGNGMQVLESSSPLSYIDSNGTIIPSSYPVLGWVSYGNGRLFLLSDSSVFINTMIDEPYNRVLLHELVMGQAYVDTSYSIPTRLLSVKWMIEDVYGFMGRLEVLYGVVLLISFLVYRFEVSNGDEIVLDEVEQVLNKYPEWDRMQLRWLREQRRDNGNK